MVYFLAIALAKGAGVVGTALSRLTLMSVGAVVVPVLILIELKGLPKLSAAPFMTNPVRLTLPTTSVVPAEVAAGGIVNTFAAVERSPAVRVSTPLQVAFAFRLTPFGLLIVRLLRTVVLTGISGPVVIDAAGAGAVYTILTVAPKVGAEPSDPPLRETIAPFPSVRFAPLVNAPSVRVRVVETV